MTFSIPDIYLAFCGGVAFGVVGLLGLANLLTARQRRRNRRP
jgi:hypothetical protein